MMTLNNGLKNSLVILELLRNDEDLKNISVSVGCFTNCREQGLTFSVSNKDNFEYFTFCIYEHRNSDAIILNGKKGLISLNGDLPYISDNKWDCIKEFSYNGFYECSEYLKKEILKVYNGESEFLKEVVLK